MVEWKKLGEVCKVHTGSQLNRSDMLAFGPYPVVNGGREYSGYTDNFNEKANSITISQGGESAGFVNWIDVYFWAGAHCYVVEIPDYYDTRYIYHTLKNNERVFQTSKQGAGIPGLNRETLYKQIIPIPSLQEQQRIVGILDTFTASIDNLKEQIAQRRKQYEYYRDQLLDLEGKPGVEMKMLGEVFDTRNGYTPSTSNEQFWVGGTIPWFKMEDIRDNGRILHDSYLHITPTAVKGKGLFKANSIILATSATIGEHALILVDYLCNQRFTNFFPKEKYTQSIEMKYVYYYMFIIDEWCKQHVNQGGFASVEMSGLYNMSFPIPSLQEQQRIVSILDTFEDSIQNLEAQLEQREKQYEYYRNKLLTFE